MRLWDVKRGTELRQLRSVRAGAHVRAPVAFSPDGKRVAANNEDRGIIVWDTATGKVLHQSEGDLGLPLQCLVFSPDGRFIATAGEDGRICIWDAVRGQPVFPLRGHVDRVEALAFASNGRWLVSTGRDKTARLWDVQQGTERWQQLLFDDNLTLLAFSPDSQIVVAAAADGDLLLRETRTGKEAGRFHLPPGGAGIKGGSAAFSSDGKTLVVATVDDRIHWLDVPSGRLLRSIRLGKSPVNLSVLSPDGRLVATGDYLRGRKIRDTATGKELLRFGNNFQWKDSIVWSPDGRLVAWTESDEIHITDVPTGKELGHLWGGNPVFSPDGRLLAWGNRYFVHLVEVATCSQVSCFGENDSELSALAFSPDGRTLAAGSAGSLIHLWDAFCPECSSEDQMATPREPAALWADLASKNGATAYRAVFAWLAAPDAAVSDLGKRLRPVPRVEGERIQLLLRNLDNDTFSVRERAQQELEKLGWLAEPELRQVLAAGASPEARRRVNRLLRKLEVRSTSPERLRTQRAVGILERIDNRPARQLLERLAQGAPQAQLTQEAKAALKRLAQRPSA